MMNESLAGFVAIAANPLAVSTGGDIIVGAIGCLVMIGLDSLLIWWQFDAVGAIPVYLGAGIWGALAVSLFGDLDRMGITVGVG